MGISSKLSPTVNKQNTETTIIASGASLNGVFYFDTFLHVHGKINGYIHSKSLILICKDGFVSGELVAPKVVINGKFKGSIDCDNLEILEGGVFEGTVKYKNLSIEKNSYFDGISVVKKEDKNTQKEFLELKEEIAR